VAYLWIALGAVVGASARYFLSGFIAKVFPSGFPYGTLIINITGSLLLGFFLVWTSERVLIDARWRLLIAIGFCGSYTTFSSYACVKPHQRVAPSSFALLHASVPQTFSS
jgi:CrcB protein